MCDHSDKRQNMNIVHQNQIVYFLLSLNWRQTKSWVLLSWLSVSPYHKIPDTSPTQPRVKLTAGPMCIEMNEQNFSNPDATMSFCVLLWRTVQWPVESVHCFTSQLFRHRILKPVHIPQLQAIAISTLFSGTKHAGQGKARLPRCYVLIQGCPSLVL